VPGWVRNPWFQGSVVLALVVVGIIVGIALQYDQTGIEEQDGVRRVRSEGERCLVTLPEGWSWRPATWTAVSPLGTTVGIAESLYGRPQNPDWEEAVAEIEDRYAGREGVTVTTTDTQVRVEFGPEGGASWLRKFDRVGCQLTFSATADARQQEEPVWEAMYESLERTTPPGSREGTPTP
jgi:hypothetical protein